MAEKGMGAAAIVGIVVVVLVGATVFGYMYLLPANQHSSTTQSQSSSVSTVQSVSSTTQGNVEISNAALSNTTLLVTIQNTGTQAVSINSVLVTPGSGCPSTKTSTSTSTSQTSQSSQTNRTRTGFALPACFARSAVFLVQSNSTLSPVPIGRFNFSAGLFNSTRSFSRSGNFSRAISGNLSRTISGNFSRGFIGLGNFSRGGGIQLAAGQSVTLAYSGPIGSGVTAGSQYTIVVSGQQTEAQITLPAS
ncbi:MAG TPA: hypothetical protein VND41_01285 [Nitrososphaerales archaeon]|nr:hypothetical protein [Nitrososphaerales archaeon]